MNRLSTSHGSNGFVSRLESLRGVAALMVAFFHTYVVLQNGIHGNSAALIVRLFNGNAAVTLFFVLSGLVLGFSLRAGPPLSGRAFLQFGLRRVLRIYPTFLLVTTAILGCLFFSYHGHGLLPDWFCAGTGYRDFVLNQNSPPSAAKIGWNLILWSPSLNYVTWTLGIELRCSLLLPLLHWWSLRLSGKGRGLLLLFLVSLTGVGKWCLLMGWVHGEAVFAHFYEGFAGYLFLFYLGYLLPEIGPAIVRVVARNSVVRASLPWLSAIVFLWGDAWGDEFRILQGVAAAMIICQLLYDGERTLWRALDLGVARFYGRISFGLYIWYDLVLIAIGRVLLHYVPSSREQEYSLIWSTVLLLASAGVATILAKLTYRWVEKPGIEIGRKLASRLRVVPRQAISPDLTGLAQDPKLPDVAIGAALP